jgi:hypothetical protein
MVLEPNKWRKSEQREIIEFYSKPRPKEGGGISDRINERQTDGKKK